MGGGPLPRQFDSTLLVDCPRCHEQCGWCSDYRHMHGILRLPSGGRQRCEIKGMEAEGADCPMCGGTMKVVRHTSFERAQLTGEHHG